MRDIGKNIKQLRIKANMTQEEMAEQLFVTRQTISNYENGKSRPDVEMIVSIGDLLGVDANTVIYGIPSDTGRRLKCRRVLILTGVVIVFGFFLGYFNELALMYRNHSYVSTPSILVRLLGMPFLWILLGWLFTDTLSLFVEIKKYANPYAVYLKRYIWVTLLTVAFMLIIEVAMQLTGDILILTRDSYSLSFPYIPLISDFRRFVCINTSKYPMLYAIFGILFRFLCMPKRINY